MKGSINLKQLELNKGCYISDKDFHGYNGVTRFSLQFWEKLKSHPAFRFEDILGIEMSLQERPTRKYQKYGDWFILTLWLTEHRRIDFKGFSSGYHGEGTRGTEKVLKDIREALQLDYDIDFIFKHGNENWTINLDQ